MARDEALLIQVGEKKSIPTLRLYEWQEPTLSLGYFQRFEETTKLPAIVRELPIVRRLTGGGAILHDIELTYSLALPIDHHLPAKGPNHVYEVMHDALIRCLASIELTANRDGISDDSSPTRGPFFCFARRHRFDVLLGPAKLAGSAQRRTRSAMLQHGSVILATRFASQPAAALSLPANEILARLRRDLPVIFAEAADLVSSLDTWTDAEFTLSRELERKYAGSEWTRRR